MTSEGPVPTAGGGGDAGEDEAETIAGEKEGPAMNDSWYGRPVEEVDPLIFEDTFCVISKKFNKNYIFRFSSTKSLYLLTPLNPIRRNAIYLVTHAWFDILIIITILANCVTLAMQTNNYDRRGNRVESVYDYYTTQVEYGFLSIYSLEMVLKILAKGFVLNRFSYLRNRWNILDFIVVFSGYVTLVKEVNAGPGTRGDKDLDFLRTFRVLRVVKTISILPGLKTMINALLSSVSRLLEVMALTLVCLVIFTLFSQEIFMGKLRQKCVVDKGGSEDPDRLIHIPIANEPPGVRNRLWTEWVNDWRNWKQRNFPQSEPTQCGNASDTRQCGEGYTCLGQLGENPDDGWTSFESFKNSMLSTFQLITLDYWERLYDVVVSTSGVWSLLFFLLVIFMGAYYLLNLMLAVVAMSYEDEVQLQDQGPITATQKLGRSRKQSNFSFDDLSKLNICKMMHVRKRTKSEKERLADRIKALRVGEDEEPGAKADEMHLDEAVFNILGMQFTPERQKVVEEANAEGEEGADAEKTEGVGEEMKEEKEENEEVLENEIGSGSKMDVDSAGAEDEMPQPTCIKFRSRVATVFRSGLQPVVNHRVFEYTITFCIILNTICLAVEHHGEEPWLEETLRISNNVFMAVFTSECILKLLALQNEYFQSGWNLFDLVIVISSYIDLALSETGSGSRGLSVMRSMRLLRVFKLAQSWVTMKILLNIIFASFGALGNLTCVLLIVIYIFAVTGMQVVGEQYTPAAFGALGNPARFPRWHWKHFWYAFIMVFRVLCGEWIEPMWECLKAQEHFIHTTGANSHVAYLKCFAIYLPILIVGNFIVLNLFLALLLNSFDSEELSAQREKELEASKRQENLKNIVMLMTKKADVEDEEETEVIEAAPLPPPPPPPSQKPRKSFHNRRKSTMPPFNASHAGNASKERMEPLKKAEVGQPSASAHRIRHGRHHAPESAARKRFKVAVRKVILKRQIAEAELLITRMDNLRHKKENRMAAGLFLSNPAMRDSSFHYDLTPESSEAEKLTVPGECFPYNHLNKLGCKFSRKQSFSNVTRWDKFRAYCVVIVGHPVFEYTILLLIFASSITLCFEDIYLDTKPILRQALCFLNLSFTGVFIIEMFLKMCAIGLWGYFTSFWTILDAFIVTVSSVLAYFDFTMQTCSASGANAVLPSAASNLGALKALRTLRALRPLRAISRWQGMKIVVNALIYAIPAIINVLLVCLLFWLIFSIMAVQFFKGQFYRCVDEEGERVDVNAVPNKQVCCAKSDTHGYSWMNTISNYDNVVEGYLSLLQIATFEGWMELMSYSVDAVGVDKQPVTDNQIEFYAFYVIFIIFGSFFTLQLFIGVIIDNFNMLKKKYEGGMIELLLTPTQRNYYTAMKNLGRKKPRRIFIRPKWEFRGFFYDLAMSRRLEVAIFFMIFFNSVLSVTDYFLKPHRINNVTLALNAFFATVYALEAIVKIIGLGLNYFTVPWNLYDFMLVLASICDMSMGADLSVALPLPPTMLRIVRVFRIGKILRLVKAAQGIRKLLFALVVSLPALVNIGALLGLITFIYAILGMALFGKAPRKWSVDDVFNFETFLNSNLMLLRLMTAAGWNEVLDSLTIVEPVCGTYRHIQCGLPGEPECPNRGLVVAYITSYLILTYLIVINLYIAIILENYVEASTEEDVGIVEADLDMFYNHWARFDPYATQFIDFYDLSELFDCMDPPLRVPKPNSVAIVAFNIPIARGYRVHCLDILQILIKQCLGPVDDSREFRKVQVQMERSFHKQFPTRSLLDIVSSSREWKVENNAALVIQKAWRAFLTRRFEKGLNDQSTQTRRSLLEGTKSHGGLGHMMNRLGNVKKGMTPSPSTTGSKQVSAKGSGAKVVTNKDSAAKIATNMASAASTSDKETQS